MKLMILKMRPKSLADHEADDSEDEAESLADHEADDSEDEAESLADHEAEAQVSS